MSDIQYNQLTFGELSSLVKRAVFKGELHVICEILQALHNPEDIRGLAVACAAEAGHLEMIQELLKHGSTISLECRGEAVINAALEGHHRVIHELLKNEAEITPEDWKHALRCAVENEHLESVHELAESVPFEGHSKVPRHGPKRKV
jgi:hypothetical protein